MRFVSWVAAAGLVYISLVPAASQWSYTPVPSPSSVYDPFGWNGNFPNCADTSTATQSPISISNAVPDPLLTQLVFHGSKAMCKNVVLKNTGLALVVTFPAGCDYMLDFHGTSYAFKKFQFHTLSEHVVGSGHFAAEMHMIHESAGGKKAILGVTIHGLSRDISGQGNLNNTFLGAILPDLLSPGASSSSGVTAMVNINPYSAMLPGDPSYFNYKGSLTTPPCTESVDWIIMAGSVYAAAAQVAALEGALAFHNHRPVQPLNGRVVNFWGPGVVAPHVASDAASIVAFVLIGVLFALQITLFALVSKAAGKAASKNVSVVPR